MKRTLILLSALAFASCINEKHHPEEQGGKFVFTAGFSEETPMGEDAKTKVFLDHNYYYNTLYVLWEKGDQVSIYDGQNNGKFVSDRIGLSTSLILDEGSFDESAQKYYALYPYDGGAKFEFDEENGDQYVTTTLPAEQIARRDAFSSHIAIADCTQDDKNFVFRNVTAVFKVNITTDKVVSLVFRGNNEEVVAGDIKVSYDDVSYGIAGNPSTTVTVKPEGETFVPGVYYFTVLPQTFNDGFTVTINMSDKGSLVRVVETSASVPRSSLSVGRAIGTDGSGTEQKPYLIKNKYDLEGLATIVSDDDILVDETTYISIEADIDLQTIDSWKPINNIRDRRHISKLDVEGNNHTISNFAPSTIAQGQLVSGDVDSGHNQPSLFGVFRGSVRNLYITNARVQKPDMSTVGILAGWVGYDGLETSYVENVHVSGILSGKKAVGGMSGMAYNAVFTNCSSDVNVTATGEHASGFIARFYENVSVVNCHASGKISGTTGIGGILGANEMTSKTTINVEQCSSTCAISGTYQIGGLVGRTQSPIAITQSWVKAGITATTTPKSGTLNPGKHVGGILGVSAESASVTIQENYYKGDISADGSFIGGIMGYATGPVTIENCHSHCNIENTGEYLRSKSKNYDMIGVGGILGGSVGSSLSIETCFVDEGEISSNAKGTLTAQNMPQTWSAWVEAVADYKRTSYYLGGGVGGVLGFVGTENSIVFGGNISFITSITCARTSAFDAPCAPIIGCISSAAEFDNKDKNRYYQSPAGKRMDLLDKTTGYEPRDLTTLPAGNKTTDIVVNACENGSNINQYCLYNRPVANDQDNSPCATAKNSKFILWNESIWDLSQRKPTLRRVHANVYQD